MDLLIAIRPDLLLRGSNKDMTLIIRTLSVLLLNQL
jgi:hypothetical protein